MAMLAIEQGRSPIEIFQSMCEESSRFFQCGSESLSVGGVGDGRDHSIAVLIYDRIPGLRN
jgi:hypothetical protein